MLTCVLRSSCKVILEVRCNGRAQTLLLLFGVTLLTLQKSQSTCVAQVSYVHAPVNKCHDNSSVHSAYQPIHDVLASPSNSLMPFTC